MTDHASSIGICDSKHEAMHDKRDREKSMRGDSLWRIIWGGHSWRHRILRIPCVYGYHPISFWISSILLFLEHFLSSLQINS